MIESYDFQDEAQRARYQQLTEELRCPKCQNQNLADSDSQIAADLRRELHAQLVAGKSDEAILAFMQERYGDFVLYKPRLQPSTLLLWFGPVLLIALVLAWVLRRTPESAQASPQLQADGTFAAPAPAPMGVTPQVQQAVAALLLLWVAGAALLLYRQLGAGPALEITASSQALYSGSLAPEAVASHQAQLLQQLDAYLAHHPDHEKFLYLRARTLSEAGQWEAAATDYRALVSRFPDQDNLLAEYAQVRYLQQDRVLDEDGAAFLQQALALNPQNVTALGLLGMQAFEQKQYSQAVDYWQRLVAVVPPGSAQAVTIQAGIDRARELGGLPAAAPAAGLRLAVTVTVAQAATAGPDETVFVLLRAAGQRGMPLAAARTTVAALASPVILDTASSPMQSGRPLPDGPLEVVARLSRSGQPVASAGDWEGVLALDRAAASAGQPLALEISQPVSP